MKRKVFVLGLDGATFDLLKPLIEKGLLPNLKKLIEKGTHGPLKSSIPPVTYPAWKCYSTGKNPSKLGAATWFSFDKEQRKISLVNSATVSVPEIWDIIGRFNLKSIVINMPLTYPPKKINGIMVSGVDTPDSVYFSHPPEIMKELSENLGDYRPWYNLRYVLLTKDPIATFKKTIQNRFSAIEYLYKNKEWDFFHGTIFLCDVVQHYFWTDINSLSEIWTAIDQGIGRLLLDLQNLNETTVFLISDHGFGKVESIFYFDRWLIEKGYLKPKGLFRSLLKQTKTKIDSLIYSMFRFLYSFGFDSNNKALFNIVNKMLIGSAKLLGQKSPVSWKWKKLKADALMDSITAQIYINDNQANTASEIENFKKELQSKLKNTIDIPLRVFAKHELYKCNNLKQYPDIMILPENHKHLIRGTDWGDYRVFSAKQGKYLSWSGTHRENGIFMAIGPDIKANKMIHEANILDLAPTILHILGVPIPRDIDGKVLKNIFIPRSALARKEINHAEIGAEERQKDYICSEKEKKMMKDRLKELGYI